MIVGTIGAGNIGGAFAMALVKAGNEAVIDLGSLSGGGQLIQYPGGPLPALNLVKFN